MTLVYVVLLCLVVLPLLTVGALWLEAWLGRQRRERERKARILRFESRRGRR